LNGFNYAERLLLLQAMIVRRVPSHRQSSRIQPALLMEALEADLELVRQRTPDLYLNDNFTIGMQGEVTVCVVEEWIEGGWAKRMGKMISLPEYRRTEKGQRMLDSLEPRLAEALEDMSMSDVGVLDFLGLL
jgi:hypothetical protein